MLSLKIDQRIGLKFLVKLKTLLTEYLHILTEVFGNDAMLCTWVYDWHKRFRKGREVVEDNKNPGHPSMLKTDENIKKIIQKDRYLTTRLIKDLVKIDKETIRHILNDWLNMKKDCENGPQKYYLGA